MGNEPPSDDPLKIWQNQPREIPKMTLEEIHREKARALHKKTRWEVVVPPAVLIAACLVASAISRGTIPRIACGVAILWILIVHLPAIRRTWARPPAGDAGLLSGVDFYRSELEHRLAYFRKPWRTWGKVVIPVFIAAAALVYPAIVGVIHRPALAINMVPFFALMALWFVLLFRITRQQIRQIQLELEELDALERWRQS
ncbi:MAG TPA: hypothetical protein VH640_19000 [Bryobacteraceae bacterium]|jgi:hypothetical protein